MPQQKDLKRLVRGRMRKTGESYTAARSQILKRTAVPTTRRAAVHSNGSPSPVDYAVLANMSDDAIRAKTGFTWERWVRTLDRAGALTMTHGQIVAYVREQHGVPSWWTQAVTVGYERIRGLREIGQSRDGSYEATKSKTIAASVGRVHRAFTHAPTRRRWLPVAVTIRTAVPDKSVRMTWEDRTSVEANFIAKGAGKCQVAIAHRKLPDRATSARWKAYWGERLAELSELLKA